MGPSYLPLRYPTPEQRLDQCQTSARPVQFSVEAHSAITRSPFVTPGHPYFGWCVELSRCVSLRGIWVSTAQQRCTIMMPLNTPNTDFSYRYSRQILNAQAVDAPCRLHRWLARELLGMVLRRSAVIDFLLRVIDASPNVAQITMLTMWLTGLL